MNYQALYESIIANAVNQNRVKLPKTNIEFIYYEHHHIIPKCLGGTNDNTNLVLLTAREHYVCHKILTILYPHNRKIACAFYFMTFDKRNRKCSSRDFDYAKNLVSMIPLSKETIQKISKSLKGKERSFLSKLNQSKTAQKNKLNSGENNPMFGKDPWNKGKNNIYSNDTLIKMRKPKTEEHKANLRKPNNKSWCCNRLTNENKLVSNVEVFLSENKDFVKGRIISETQRIKQHNVMLGKIPWNKQLNAN